MHPRAIAIGASTKPKSGSGSPVEIANFLPAPAMSWETFPAFSSDPGAGSPGGRSLSTASLSSGIAASTFLGFEETNFRPSLGTFASSALTVLSVAGFVSQMITCSTPFILSERGTTISSRCDSGLGSMVSPRFSCISVTRDSTSP